jgi:leader peptidase (prepilin peptidase)/N-methyltransferase
LVVGALGAGAGAIVGSFIATLCIRWSRGEQASSGRSACDQCGKYLRPLELVPVLSYAAARGRCKTCGGAISRLHISIELLASLIGGLSLTLSPGWSGAALGVFGLLLLPPAVLDVRHHWLPDRLTLIIAAAGLLVGGYLAGSSLAERLIGGASGFAVLEALRQAYRKVRAREGLGAGDPKLLGAIGCWLGWTALPLVLLVASTGGLAVAVALRLRRKDRLPFGAALALAAWTTSAAMVGSDSLTSGLGLRLGGG